MKKFKNLFFAIVGVLSLSVFTNNVNAAEVSFGKASDLSSTRTVPVYINIEEGDNYKYIDLTCSTGNEDITCTINNSSLSNNDFYPVGQTQFATITFENKLNESKEITPVVTSSISSIKVDTMNTITLNAKAVEREKSTNSKFTSFKFSKGTISPNFSSDVTEYTVYGIADTVNSVTYSYDCENCDTTQPSGGKSISGYKIYLNNGENTFTIGCVNEAGTDTTMYTFKIIRGETSYNSAKLKSLSFDGYTLSPEFDPDVKEYSVTIPNKTTSLVNAISYEAEDSAANIDVQGLDSYVVGDNKLTITVDNVNGDESITYTVTVKRMSEEEIEITKYKNKQVTFKNSDGVETTLSEDEFKTQYPDDYKTLSDGSISFDEDGNRVYITDTDEDEEETTEKKNSKTPLIIGVIVAGIIIIGVAGFFIFRKKKPNDKKDAKKGKDSKDNEEKDKVDEKSLEETKSKDLKDEVNDEDAKIDDKKEEKKEYTKEETMNIDEALSDLMSTKQYNFKDDDK